MATSQRPSLLPGAENHRHGRVSGDDGEARIVRTFHARFGSVKLGGAVTARTRIAYVHREGKHAGDAADVEATAGDKEKVIEASDRIRDTARVRRGKTAERLLATQVIELPLESTAEQRQACADAFVADWRGRGHQAVAVVHVHGEEHKQPHLHVEIAARPVGADGAVDRAATRLWAGGHPAVEVKKERARAADIVNRTCDPDPPYHPGGFRDIGVERQPRTRIPAGKFRKAREEIRDARAADDTDGAARIEAKAYAVSDEERGEKREARLARTAEIIEFKAAGLPPRPSQRARLAFAEDALEAERDRAGAVREAHSATVARAVQGLEQAGDWLGEARARADRAEASVATLTDEKQQAEDRARELEARQVQPLALTEKQRPMLEDVCARHGIEGDIGNDAQAQLRAFAALHEERDAWYHYYEKREAGEKRRAEERDEQRARAEAAEASAAALTAEKQQAETRADRAEGRVRELEALNRTQTEYVTDWHGQRKVELPDLATVDGQSAAWANMRAWEAGEKKRRKDEAAAKAGIEAELEAARERADTAEGRVRELEAGTASGDGSGGCPRGAARPGCSAETAGLARRLDAAGGRADEGGRRGRPGGIDVGQGGFLARVNAAGRHRRQPGADVHAGGRPVAEAARDLALRGHGPLCGQGGDRDRARLQRQGPRVVRLEGRSRGVVARARDRRPRGRRGNAALAGRAVPRTSTRNTGRKSAPGNITGRIPGPTWARRPAASITARGP